MLNCIRALLWINYQKLWVTFSDWMMSESLRNRTDRNLKMLHNSEKHEKYKRENIFQIKGREYKIHESNAKTSACKVVRYEDINSVSVSQSIG